MRTWCGGLTTVVVTTGFHVSAGSLSLEHAHKLVQWRYLILQFFVNCFFFLHRGEEGAPANAICGGG